MALRVEISQEVLRWAIERNGYSEPEFLQANPTVQKWLEGKTKPTIKQLENFSKKTHTPFGYFFLSKPPKESFSLPYFRTAKDSKRFSIHLYDTFLILEQRQDWLRNYLKDHEFEPLPFVGKYNQNENPQVIANDIRNTLGLKEDWANAFQDWQEAQEHFITVLEKKGIVVIFNSIVGNNTKRSIDVEECRGFVLVDEYAPFLFVNSADFLAAQMFTLAHELAHIWIGKSAAFDLRNLQPSNEPLEQLCDKVAAELLVPKEKFINAWKTSGSDFQSLAKIFKVSPIVIARRALDTDKITKERFFEFYNNYKKEIKTKPKPQGGNFYSTLPKRLSKTFCNYIWQAVQSGELLYRDAYNLTGLNSKTFEKFFQG